MRSETSADHRVTYSCCLHQMAGAYLVPEHEAGEPQQEESHDEEEGKVLYPRPLRHFRRRRGVPTVGVQMRARDGSECVIHSGGSTLDSHSYSPHRIGCALTLKTAVMLSTLGSVPKTPSDIRRMSQKLSVKPSVSVHIRDAHKYLWTAFIQMQMI